MAVVRLTGVGSAKPGAYTFPVIWADVANGLPAVRSKANPVMAVAPMGLTPISPVIAEVGIVEIPDLARITKLPAVPRFTGACTAAATPHRNITAAAGTRQIGR